MNLLSRSSPLLLLTALPIVVAMTLAGRGAREAHRPSRK